MKKYKSLIATFSLYVFLFTTLNAGDIEKLRILEKEGWSKVPEILKRITPPSFPNRSFNVLDYGAIGDGITDCYLAFNKAINECSKMGGGRVVVPPGKYLSNGPIHLLSNVNLHLEESSTIVFGSDPKFYTPLVLVRWEGTLCYNYSPLIYAYEQKNIAITGKGTIDGRTQDFWFKWKRDNYGMNQEIDKQVLRKMGNDVIPIEQRVFGNGFLDLNKDGEDDGFGDNKDHYLRPTLIDFMKCENILLEGVSLCNSPFWTVHPTFCKNVTIRELNIKPGITNDDGIDPDSCIDVLIEGCTIFTLDDAIAIKAGRDQDAWHRGGSENIIIRNNDLSSGVNAFCIGSEMSGNVKNIFFENNHIRLAGNGLNFKCNLDRGGRVENVFIRNITMGKINNDLLYFQMDYQGYRGNNFPTKFINFFVNNIHCHDAGQIAFRIVGVEAEPIQQILLSNIIVERTPKAKEVNFTKDIFTDNIIINGKQWQL